MTNHKDSSLEGNDALETAVVEPKVGETSSIKPGAEESLDGSGRDGVNSAEQDDALEPLAPEPIEATKQGVPRSLFIAYLTLVLGLFTFGVGTIIGVIIATIKKGDYPAGSFEYSHHRYIQRSFWYCLLWTILTVPTMFVGIGFFLIYIPSLWYIYRIVKGCLRVAEGTNMYPHEKYS